MSPSTPCPQVGQLRGLLLGHVSRADAEQLERHLTSCTLCQSRLPELAVPDALLDVLRQSTPLPLSEEDRPLVEELAQRLKCLPALGRRSDVTLFPVGQASALGQIGDYRLRRVLGSGGMGIVFEAEDTRLRRLVALKIMKPALAASSSARERFLREARVMAALKHEHIVTIYQVGEDNDVPFLAMELLEGRSLEQRLGFGRDAAPLPVREIVRIGRETAEGLAAAHEKGLIHRDIKPANIWLEGRPGEPGASTSGGKVKLLDFGLAWAAEQEVSLTQTGTLIGTPAYMAPEQARATNVGPRSDLFSLGCVLYRMATGREPFEGRSPSALLLAVAMDEPAAANQLNPAIPPALSGLIARLLAKAPGDRPTSARDVAGVLAALPIPPARTSKARNRGRLRLGLGALAIGLCVALTLLMAHWWKQPLPSTAPTQGLSAALGALDRLRAEDIPATARFDGQPQELVAVVGDLGPAFRCLAFTPDGTALLGSRGREVSLWDVASGRQRRTYPPSAGDTFCIAIAPDAQRFFAAGQSRPAAVYAMDDGRELVRLEGAGDCIFCATFSPDGARLLTGDRDAHAAPGSLRHWDSLTGKELACLRGHSYYVVHAAFLGDGQRAVTFSHSLDPSVRVWDLRAKRCLRSFGPLKTGISGLAISPDHAQVAVGCHGEVRLFDLEGPEDQAPRVLGGHSGEVVAILYGPTGKQLISVANDYRILWHDPRTGSVVRQHKLAGSAHCVAIAADGRHIAVANSNGTIFLFRLFAAS